MSKACSAEGTGVVDFVGSAIGPFIASKPHDFRTLKLSVQIARHPSANGPTELKNSGESGAQGMVKFSSDLFRFSSES